MCVLKFYSQPSLLPDFSEVASCAPPVMIQALSWGSWPSLALGGLQVRPLSRAVTGPRSFPEGFPRPPPSLTWLPGHEEFLSAPACDWGAPTRLRKPGWLSFLSSGCFESCYHTVGHLVASECFWMEKLPQIHSHPRLWWSVSASFLSFLLFFFLLYSSSSLPPSLSLSLSLHAQRQSLYI